MITDPNFIYLIMALGAILLLWIISLLILVLLLRRQLKTVTEQRDQLTAQLHTLTGLIGRTATIRQGDYQGQSGVVLWIQEEDVGLQIGRGQMVTTLANLTIEPDKSAF